LIRAQSERRWSGCLRRGNFGVCFALAEPWSPDRDNQTVQKVISVFNGQDATRQPFPDRSVEKNSPEKIFNFGSGTEGLLIYSLQIITSYCTCVDRETSETSDI